MLEISGQKVWHRPFKNAGKLLVGRGVQGVLSIAYLAFATRTLGAIDFGVLTLIHSSILLLRHVFGFQSWQMVLRFGAKALEAKDAAHMLKLIFFAASIEFAAGFIGFVGLCIFSAEVLDVLNIYKWLKPMLCIYASMLVVLLVSDVGLGILRLTNRHDFISWQVVIEPIIRFFGAGALFLFGGTLTQFLWVWFIAGIASRIGLILIAGANLKTHIKTIRKDAKLENLAIPPIQKGKFRSPQEGLWKYVIGTNVDYALSLGITQLGPVLIGGALGPAAAGLYRVAQQFANIIGHPIGKMLLPAIYTDMTWLNAKGGAADRRNMVFKTGLVAGAGACVAVAILALFGKPLIGLIAGHEFEGAYGVMLVLAFSTVVGALSFALEPLLMTAGKVKQVIGARLIATVAYIIMLLWWAEVWGLMGAGYAVLARALIFIVFAWIPSRKLLAKEATL